MSKFLCVIALVSSFLFSQVTLADESYCKESLSKIVQSLHLDDSQKAKVKPILDQLKTGVKTAASQMQGLEDQISQQVNTPNMDQQKVNTLVDTKTKLIGDMIKAKLVAKNQILQILNPEQKEKLQKIVKKAEDKMAALFKDCTEED